MNSNRKPVWPYTDVILCAHMGAGQWYKTIGGKMKYFGVLSDPTSARRKYIALLNRQEQDQAPLPARSEVTLEFMANRFLERRADLVAKGEKSAGQFARYRAAVKFILSNIDRHARIADLTPQNFTKLRDKIPGGLVNKSNVVRDIRTMFHWGQKHFDVLPRYGDEFDKPGKRAIRMAATQRELWRPEEIRALLAGSRPALRAFIFLGINCGFGQTDCSGFNRAVFDLTIHWMPRGKTGIDRRCPFWPETISAICNYQRPEPKLGMESRFFVTDRGAAWVSETITLDEGGAIEKVAYKDNISQELKKLCVALGIKYRPFYTFRHTFRSVADQVPDTTAINCIMGHAAGGMREVYTQLMGDGMRRLKTITDHIHAWLFDHS